MRWGLLIGVFISGGRRSESRAMVIKTESCRFSGLRIYPGHGITMVRVDSQIFKFLNSKCKRLYGARPKPSKLAWSVLYRKQHKKGQEDGVSRKKRRVNKAAISRSIVGASLEVIQKKRAEKTEVRQAQRDAAMREIKERNKKAQADKKVRKAAESKKGPAAAKNVPQKSMKAGPKAGKR